MTLNTWQKCGPWKERWRAILEALEFLQPDVVAFQELFDAEWRDGIARRAAYPFVAPVEPSASGLVLLSRVPIGGTGLEEFAARSPRENYSRYLVWAELFHAGRRIHVFNTHLSWMAEDEATRLAQLREVAAQIERRCAANRFWSSEI
jgi:endonuclease/exonuclease/phosphatase family metal-dependent hydrolase